MIDLRATLPQHPTKRWVQRTKRPDLLCIHHSVTPGEFSIEQIARYHIDAKGDPGIAYHYVISASGVVSWCNDDMVFTWHGNDGNTGLGICLLGDFTNAPPPAPQLKAAAELVAALKAKWGITRIIGHREAGRARTACPGDAFTNDMIHALGQEVSVPTDPFARYPRPPEDTGAGLHMSPGANFPMGENDGLIPGILDECRRMGLRWVKLVDQDGSSYNAARMCLAGGVMPVVRLYRDRPYPGQLTHKQRNVARDLVAAGVRYFERGNEPNLDVEWRAGAWPGNDWNAWTDATFDRLAADWLADARYMAGLGAFVAIDALSGGGNYDDILCFANILKALKRAGATQLLRDSAWIASHPAGLNHPLNYPDDARNQQDHPGVTILGGIPGEAPSSPSNCIRKPEKLHAMFQAEMGFELPLLATEGGFWPGSKQDPRYAALTPQTASEMTAAWLRSMRTAPAWYLAAMPWCYFNRLAGNLHQGFEHDAWKRVPGWGNCPANEPAVLPVISMLLQNPCQRRMEVVPMPTPTPPPTPTSIPNPPDAAMIDRIRNAGVNAIADTHPLPYNPAAAFPSYARTHGLGAPLTGEVNVATYRLQGYALGIVYALVPNWAATVHMSW